MDLYGRDLICTQEWELDELETVLELAAKMKRDRYSPSWTSLLEYKTFLMFFYNPSVRTRQSFEVAATELGGHAQFLEPRAMRLKTATSAGETVEDAAQVMSRFAHGLGIRILEDQISEYGEGDALLREYAKWASIPVISMAHDKYHPCQGLADVLGLRQHIGGIRGKKTLVTWARGALARSWCSPQEYMMITSRLGMDVTIAFPEGYSLDTDVLETTKANCEANGATFEITHDAYDGYDGADVVYSRNWVTPGAYAGGMLDKATEITKAMAQAPDWMTDEEKMAKTNDAYFVHPMPVDRGAEVTDAIASGPRSIIYDIAENRLHVQKALMALTMCPDL
jgi:ornithine carbamoyltransferase